MFLQFHPQTSSIQATAPAILTVLCLRICSLSHTPVTLALPEASCPLLPHLPERSVSPVPRTLVNFLELMFPSLYLQPVSLLLLLACLKLNTSEMKLPCPTPNLCSLWSNATFICDPLKRSESGSTFSCSHSPPPPSPNPTPSNLLLSLPVLTFPWPLSWSWVGSSHLDDDQSTFTYSWSLLTFFVVVVAI